MTGMICERQVASPLDLEAFGLDLETYAKRAIESVDEFYATTEIGELGWDDLLAVADHLDNINGNLNSTSEIFDTIKECHVKSRTVEKCVQRLCILHFRNYHAINGLNHIIQTAGAAAQVAPSHFCVH